MSDADANVRGLFVHARRVPVAERTGFAAAARAELGGQGLILETCHRVEAYAATEAAMERLARLIPPDGTLAARGEPAIRHAIAVAVGRDSVVVGEDQILHQLRASVDAARAWGGLDPVLERLFASALHAGRRARSWRQGPPDSLATVALSAIELRIGSMRDRPMLVVGAGRMGRLVARTAADAGVRVSVANRSAEAALRLAREIGGTTVPFDPRAEAGSFDAILLALGGPWQVGGLAREAIAGSSAIVVDLSVPIALDAPLSAGLGDRLVTGDDLARADAPSGAPDSGTTRRLDALVERTTADFLAWLDGRAGRAAAAALASVADAARAAELDTLWRQLPDLDPESRAVIDAMTQHLAARLLREPLERLGNDPDGRTERAVREVFAL